MSLVGLAFVFLVYPSASGTLLGLSFGLVGLGGNFSQLVLALEISWTAISFCKSCLALDSLFTVALSLTLPIDAVVSFH